MFTVLPPMNTVPLPLLGVAGHAEARIGDRHAGRGRGVFRRREADVGHGGDGLGVDCLARDFQPVGEDPAHQAALAVVQTRPPRRRRRPPDASISTGLPGVIALDRRRQRHAEHHRHHRRADVAERFAGAPEVLEFASPALQPQARQRRLLEGVLLADQVRRSGIRHAARSTLAACSSAARRPPSSRRRAAAGAAPSSSSPL